MFSGNYNFEPLINNGSSPPKLNHAELNRYNNRRANLRDELADQFGVSNAITEDNIKHYNGEFRRSPLDYREKRNVVTRGHRPIKQKKKKELYWKRVTLREFNKLFEVKR